LKKVSLIVGGVRSGKSSLAVEKAEKSGKEVVFVATCAAHDDEMKRRIELHKQSRPKNWEVIEEEINLGTVFNNIKKDSVVIVDCLGLWISNLLLKDYNENQIKEEIEKMVNCLAEINYEILFVSNEVGMGVVPDSYLGRVFRDYLGLLNQKIAKIADEVIVMHVGIPVKIK
jgi:adenosylcobinamide kinase / adenosylcobinamide-phosphate guanylyltransferase